MERQLKTPGKESVNPTEAVLYEIRDPLTLNKRRFKSWYQPLLFGDLKVQNVGLSFPSC